MCLEYNMLHHNLLCNKISHLHNETFSNKKGYEVEKILTGI